MKMTTAIAMGFMDGKKSLVEVFQATVDFLGRKLDRKEANNIIKAYKNRMTLES